MHQSDKLEQAQKNAFEPSHLVEYGDAREQTRSSPQITPRGSDGSQYNS